MVECERRFKYKVIDMWIKCEERLPTETKQGQCTVSEVVEVKLKDGTIDTDWLINGKWVIYCKLSCKNYPVEWRKMKKGDQQ